MFFLYVLTVESLLQVELLCRRASGDAKSKHCGRIYCFAFIDLLSYEVATFAEKCIEKYCFNTPGNYTASSQLPSLAYSTLSLL